VYFVVGAYLVEEPEVGKARYRLPAQPDYFVAAGGVYGWVMRSGAVAQEPHPDTEFAVVELRDLAVGREPVVEA
jgi:hypothetical protein